MMRPREKRYQVDKDGKSHMMVDCLDCPTTMCLGGLVERLGKVEVFFRRPPCSS